MDDVHYQRDFLDLSYYRTQPTLPRKLIQGRRVALSQNLAMRQDKLNERRLRLNRISMELCLSLQRNHAIIACIGFATHLITPSTESITPLEVPERLLPPARPDVENEEEIIRARLATAHDNFPTNILIDSLKRINQAIMQINVEPSTALQAPKLFYRAAHKNSHTFYDAELGFCCAKWLHRCEFLEPSQDEFCAHVGESKDLESPYISLSDDPGRTVKYGHCLSNRRISDLRIFVICATKLRQMGVHIEATTILAEKWGIRYKGSSDRLHYVTDSHWLANHWIPVECIVGDVSFIAFKEVCQKSGIIDESTNEVRLGKTLNARAFEGSWSLAKNDQRVRHANDSKWALEEKMNSLSVSESLTG